MLSLKQEMREELRVQPPGPPAVFTATAGVAARHATFVRRLETAHTRAVPSGALALGVAPGRSRNDFRLGARVQAAGAAGARLKEAIVERARGDAEVRVVPRVRKRAPRPAWFRSRRRPLEAGLSCGHYAITAGTLGFIVDDDDAFYILSNNHVLANVNAGAPGDPVVQPGPSDWSGRRRVTSRTLVGVLDRYVPLSFQRSNVVDCAVAELLPDLSFYAGWTEALPGIVRGTRPLTVADLGRPVFKAGRTTGVTRGVVSLVSVDRLLVDMGDGTRPKNAQFSDQLEIQGVAGRPFSAPGDSGALIVDERGYARALLFAGGADEEGNDLTYANRIESVLQKLGVRLVT